jgi:hypothetical protein
MALIALSFLPLSGLVATFTLMNALRLLGLYLASKLALGLYNISPLHPLYHFPAPRLVAMSFTHELYYDLILVGRYSQEIKRMHDRYGISHYTRFHGSPYEVLNRVLGPIVRINPEELHCNDPDFADEIAPASTARIRDRHRHFLKSFADLQMWRLQSLGSMSCTGDVRTPSAVSSPARRYCGWSPRSTPWSKRCAIRFSCGPAKAPWR